MRNQFNLLIFLWLASNCVLRGGEVVLTNRYVATYSVVSNLDIMVCQRVLPPKNPAAKQVEALKVKDPGARYATNYMRIENVASLAACRT